MLNVDNSIIIDKYYLKIPLINKLLIILKLYNVHIHKKYLKYCK